MAVLFGLPPDAFNGFVLVATSASHDAHFVVHSFDSAPALIALLAEETRRLAAGMMLAKEE